MHLNIKMPKIVKDQWIRKALEQFNAQIWEGPVAPVEQTMEGAYCVPTNESLI